MASLQVETADKLGPLISHERRALAIHRPHGTGSRSPAPPGGRQRAGPRRGPTGVVHQIIVSGWRRVPHRLRLHALAGWLGTSAVPILGLLPALA